MRARWWGGGAALAFGLACAGGADTEGPDAAPPRDAAPDAVAPADREIEPPDPEGTLGDSDGTVSLLWLAEDGGECQLKTHDLPSGEERSLARLGGACPQSWRIAIPPASSRVVVYSEDRAWVISKEGVRRVEGTQDGIDLVAFDGQTILACGEIDAPVTEGDDGLSKWTYEGKTYEFKDEMGMGAVLVRTFALEQSGWTQKAIAPRGLYEGMRPPFCGGVEGWPRETVDLAPNKEPDESEFHPASEEELAGLKTFDEEGASWHVSQQGGVAVRTEWLEGTIFLWPVVSRTAPGSPWALVPELNAEGHSTPYDVSGPFLLINGKDKSVLRDVRGNQELWTSTVPAVFWREGISLPELPGVGGAEGGEASEEGDPAKAKTKGKAKMKAKMKAKAGGGE